MKIKNVVTEGRRKGILPTGEQNAMMQKLMGRFQSFLAGLTKTENGNYYVPACSSKRGKNYKKIGLGKLGVGGTSRQRRVREGKNW